jgi:hypothetical protein
VEAPQCWRVSHPNASNFLLLTWRSTTFEQSASIPYTGDIIKTRSLMARRVYRIHATGSNIECFTIAREGRRRPENCYSTEDKRLHLLCTEADILGDVGFTRLVKHSQRARRWIRLPSDTDVPNIGAEIEFERDLFSRLQAHVFKLHGPLSYPPAPECGTSSLNSSVSMDPLNHSF